ncbi:MAG: hypothetical protein C0501_17795 [Isosphaera sp.]|nr:hypothetical protein [Isosphaera sp.]
MTAAAPTPAAFRSLAELQDRHAAVSHRVGKDVSAPDHLAAVEEFVRRAAATGAVLDAREDRAAAQSLINFWVSRLSASVRGAGRDGRPLSVPDLGDTLLAPFDPGEVAAAAAVADAWLAAASPDERRLARRVLLRLVRMRPAGAEFDAVPVVRAALYDLDAPEAVDAVLARLAAAGVVRRKPGDAPELDVFSLRAPGLMATWRPLADAMSERVRFRDGVGAWAGADRPPGVLADGDPLEDARRYHDRNPAEREYVAASLAEQGRRLATAAADRRWKRAWRTLAGFAAAGWAVAVVLLVFEIRARRAADAARREAETLAEMVELDGSAQGISFLALATLLQDESKEAAVHAARKLLLLQTVRQVVFARNPKTWEAARGNWDRLRRQLAEDPKGGDWFDQFFGRQRPDPTNPFDPGHKEEFDLLTGGPPVDGMTAADLRARVRALRTVSEYLWKYIVVADTRAALGQIRPGVVGQAADAAEKLAEAAAAGKPLADARPHRVAFWRVYGSGVVLLAPGGTLKEAQDSTLWKQADEVAAALTAWEDAGGGPAAPDVRDRLRKAADALRAVRADLGPGR